MKPRWVSTVGLAALTLASVGCLSPRQGPRAVDGAETPVFRGQVGPFAPASLRVHPLTHLERDADGSVFLLVHVQLRDRWSDICKGVGNFQFYMYRPTGLGGSGQEEQVRRWEVDMYPLDRNAVFFDPATQTYRFSLGELPDWVEQMAPGGDRTADGPGRFRVIARFTTPTPDGGQTVLVDELVLGR